MDSNNPIQLNECFITFSQKCECCHQLVAWKKAWMVKIHHQKTKYYCKRCISCENDLYARIYTDHYHWNTM